ncbi:Fe2+-dicitrate sensor protein [Pelomonas sp. HMWF004]|nr:Fe2+-dicitrate sensor protein [Pelomonas sp. HMWF004]
MTATRALPPDATASAVEAAIRWMVRLQSGDATPHDHQACQRWQQEQPENAQAWAAIDAFSQQLKALPRALVHTTLARPPRPRRRMVLKSVMLLGGAGGLGLASTQGGWHALAADYRTGVGERRRVALPDGSVLHLNTATALDVHADAHERCVNVRAGEVLVECAPDGRMPSPLPLRVQTAESQVRASSGRFIVRQFAGRTSVHALTGGLDVHPRAPAGSGLTHLRVEPGQQWLFDAQGAGLASPADESAAAWTDGVIVARSMRLSTLTAELARYHRGWLRCDQAVAEWRVSGVFPVDDIGRVVAALQRTLPVRARAVTPWWVTLGPR